jgi:Uma2 family endonuclease
MATIWTASEVIAHFGDIPIARIRTTPRPGHATEDDVVELYERHKLLCELIDGTLVEKTMGWQESYLAVWISTLLNNFVRPNKLGKVFGSDGMLRLEPAQIRIPDVSFISKQRFAGRKLKPGAFWELGCDLAVEVVSPGNTRREMERKLIECISQSPRSGRLHLSNQFRHLERRRIARGGRRSTRIRSARRRHLC